MWTSVLSMVVTASMASAQTPAPTAALNPASALRKGLGFSLEVQRAESARRQTDGEFSEAESLLFPRVNLTGAAGTQKFSALPRAGFFQSQLTQNENYRAALTVSQPLLAGGALVGGISAAKLSRDIAAQRVFEAKQNYAHSVLDAYFQAAQTQILLDLARDNRTVLKGYAAITARYAAIGRSKNIDRMTAEASYSLSEAEVLSAEAEYERTSQDLYRWLGENNPSATRLATALPLQPVETGSLEQLYEKARENNPSLRILQLQVEERRYRNDVELAEYNPRLSLDGSWGYDSPDRPNTFTETSEAYSIFLNLTIPIWYGFGSFAQKRQNTERVYQAQKDLEIRQRDLLQSLARSLATLSREFNRLKLTQDSAASARKAMEVALRDYRNGLLSSIDVLNIQRTHYDADRQYAMAQFAYHRQVLNLRRDLGIDLEKTYGSEK